jgi:hypothetical protein
LSGAGPAKRSAEATAVYRAIGRYMVAFSYLVSEMRAGIETRFDSDSEIARLALGEAFVSQIANAFFAICEYSVELDDEEQQVAIRLKKEVNDAIKDRNDIAHGDWHIRSWRRPEPHMVRTKPGRRAGAVVEKARPVEELEELSDALEDLAETVIEFALLCFAIHPNADQIEGEVRVRDIYRFRNHRVVRQGRYAAFHPWDDD